MPRKLFFGAPLFDGDGMPDFSNIRGHGKDGHFFATGNQLLPLDKVSVLKFELTQIDPEEDEIVLGVVNLDVDDRLDIPIHEQNDDLPEMPHGQFIAASVHRDEMAGPESLLIAHGEDDEAGEIFSGFQRAEQGDIVEFITEPIGDDECKVQIRINSVPLWSADPSDGYLFGVMENNNRCTLHAGVNEGYENYLKTNRWVPFIGVSKRETIIQMHKLREPNETDTARWDAGSATARAAFEAAEGLGLVSDDDYLQPVDKSLRL